MEIKRENLIKIKSTMQPEICREVTGSDKSKLQEVLMMDKTLNVLFVIASVGLAVAALIFISIAIFSDAESEWILPAGLFCCVLGNLFNLIRYQFDKRISKK